MKKQDQLVSLIRAMTSSEKRYFKLFCSLQKGEKFYLQLFDYVDRTEDPTNPKIQAKFKGHPQIHYLPRIKHYLFHLILRSLRSFHDEKSVESQLYNRMNEIRILNDKGLWEMAADLVEKAVELSKVHHLHSIRMELYRWRSRLADSMYDLDMIRSVIDHDYTTAAVLRKEIDEYFQYLAIYDQFYYFHKRKGIYANDAALKELKNIMDSPLMQDDALPSFFYSKLLYYSVRSTYALLIPGRIKESVHFSSQLLLLMENNPEIVKETPKTYFAVMHNLLSRLSIMGDEKMFYEKIKEYRKFPELLLADKRNLYQPRVYINSLHLELEFNYRHESVEKAYELWKNEEKKVLAMQDGMSIEMRMVLLMSGAKVCWINGRYQDSNKILNRIIHHTENEELREDIWFTVYFLKILNYYESRDEKGITVACKNFLRQYVENAERGSMPDVRIIRFIQKYYKQLTSFEPDEKVLKAELEGWLESITSVQDLNMIKYYESFYVWLYATAHKTTVIKAFPVFMKIIDTIEERLLHPAKI